MRRMHRTYIIHNTAVLWCLVFVLLSGCGKSVEQRNAELDQRTKRAQSLIAGGAYNSALQLLRGAADEATKLQNDTAFGQCVLLTGVCQRYLGEYDSALHAYQSAIERFHEIADKHRERKARIRLAEMYEAVGRHRDALSIAADAGTEAMVFNDTRDRYEALLTKARSLIGLGRYDDEKAVVNDLLSLDARQLSGDSRVSIFRIGMSAAVASGRASDVADLFHRWVAAASEVHDNAGISEAYLAVGNWHRAEGRPDSAQRSYQKALEPLTAGSGGELRADVWAAMGTLAYAQHQYENARDDFQKGLDGSRTSHLAGKGLLFQLGELAAEARLGGGDPPKLLQKVRNVIDTCIALSFRRGAAFGWYLAGTLADEIPDQLHAVEYYRNAWALAREWIDYGEPGSDIVDSYFLAEGKDWFRSLSGLYAAELSVDSLFALAEDRSLHDLAAFMRRLAIKTRDQSLNKRIDDVDWTATILRRTMQDMDEVLQATDAQRSERISSLIASAGAQRAALKAATRTLESANKNFAWLLSTTPVSLRDIRAALPAGAVLVEFVPTDNALALIVVRGDTARLRISTVEPGYLRSLVRDYLQLMGELRLNIYGLRLSEPLALQRINELSSVLYNVMIGPVSGDLRGSKKIYVVLPEELSWLPVHTLRGEGGALGQRYNVSYLPAASALLLSSPVEHWTSSIAGIGYPGSTGWDVEYELKDIRSFYDRTPMFFDTSATLRHLTETMYNVIHCAAEFSLDRSVPNNSHMVLSDGIHANGTSNVSLGEMSGIPAPDILVFSNIGNRPGQLYRYVPALYLALGTRTVITTMWQGDRKAKKVFGEQFYTALLAGQTGTDAYGQAIREMANNPDANHVQRWGLYYQYGK